MLDRIGAQIIYLSSSGPDKKFAYNTPDTLSPTEREGLIILAEAPSNLP